MAFNGGSDYHPSKHNRRITVNGIDEDIITGTSGRLDIWVNGTSGNDNNDGLTSGSAKQTLEAGLKLLPQFINHLTVINCRGTITLQSSSINIEPFVSHRENPISDASSTLTPSFIIDGGSDTTTISGSYTSDIASTTSIGDSGQTWTPDQFFGLWVKITSGNLSGQIRTIATNSSTTITPARNFSSAPTAGDTFEIVRPATQITSTGTKILNIKSQGSGRCLIQRLYFSGNALLQYGTFGNPTLIQLIGIISDTTTNGCIFLGNGSATLSILGFWFNVDAVAFLVATTDPWTGVSQRSASSSIRLLGNSSPLSIQGIFARRIEMYNSLFNTTFLTNGSRILAGTATTPTVEIRNCKTNNFTTDSITNTSGYATSSIDNFNNTNAIGLFIGDDSVVRLGAINIRNCTTHAIRCDNSRLIMGSAGNITGENNSGFSFYAHAGSMVDVTGTPSLTGTLGNITVDGTTPTGSWTDLAAGSSIFYNPEFCFIRKV